MNELITKRSIELIASEINFYKAQTAAGIIEVGKRLIEAQELLGEGETFTDFLKNQVDFSRRSAYNFIRVAKEFNDVQALAQLGQTKVFQLLELPENEREKFMNSTHEINGEEKKINDMTTRELQQAIKDRDAALAKVKLQESLNDGLKKLTDNQAADNKKILEEKKKLQESLEKERDAAKALEEKHNKSIEELKRKLEDAKEVANHDEEDAINQELEKKEQELAESNRRIAELEKQLKDKPIEVSAKEVVEVIPEAISKELQELREKNQHSKEVVKFQVCFEKLKSSFNDLIAALDEIKETNNSMIYEKYLTATKKLINIIQERV